MIGIGIDFGTSNSAAAWFDGTRVRLVQLESDEAIMPTATHLDRELRTKIGKAAVQQYIDENRDRIVELTPEIVGKSDLLINESNPDDPTSNPEIASVNVYGQANVDRGMPGRLFRGVKRLLGNASVKRLMVFDRPFRLVALITPVLLHIRQSLQQAIPEPLGDVHFGHPVLFEGTDAHRNDLGLERLEEASRYAGFPQISFYPEPVAATLSFLHAKAAPAAGGRPAAGKVLTLDFGGGTLDLSVVAFTGTEFNVLSTAGLALGGDHIDQLIFAHLLFPLLGKGENWSRMRDGQLISGEFPFEDYADKLLNWAVTYTLNQNNYKARLAEVIAAGGAAAEKFQRLEDLITHNYSYIVFQAIKLAKADLSEVEETIVDIPELDILIPFNRQQFETMMADMLVQIDDIIDLVLARAQCQISDIDVVIRTGGSSQIAAVRRLLERRFPGKVTEHDPFTGVAAGLAIASYYGYQFDR
jgi:hypothetical chaperone protein